MTNKEILQLAIEKAIKQGYKNCYMERNGWKVECGVDSNTGKVDTTVYCGEGASFSAVDIIFSHEFAEAFWGKEEEFLSGDLTVDGFENVKKIVSWKYHLQKMVLTEDPLTYLRKFL